ncbi:uncharacterized protein LY89DRAFT_727436 [Mollisia scopiformis]|uniref:Uncharacterized protein n=1 Tax=Mollisia scopiformis TaxID=149040 RepID=A0A194XVZ7_MOLSC|nr:uncharacterized protein LY89DRAFT_727436 [Mollisia scopiformis]KUJ24408.1 hypothetical protein LY89DRAFT_727436 [Mollisia scopiformis]
MGRTKGVPSQWAPVNTLEDQLASAGLPTSWERTSKSPYPRSCKSCRADLSNLNAKQQQQHHADCMLGTAPDQFDTPNRPYKCPYCHADITNMTVQEQHRHLDNCMPSTARNGFTPRISYNCTFCHTDLKDMSVREQREHMSDCVPSTARNGDTPRAIYNCTFCHTDLANMSIEDRREHMSACLPSTAPNHFAPREIQEEDSFIGTRHHVPSTMSGSLEIPSEAATNASIHQGTGEESLDSSSRLTSPPESPVIAALSERGFVADPEMDDDELDVYDDTIANDENAGNGSQSSGITPYVQNELEYYDFDEITETPAAEHMEREPSEFPQESQDPQTRSASDGSEAPETKDVGKAHTNESDADLLRPQNPKVKHYGFPKLTEFEDFEQYLANPEEMSLEMLFRRTANVSKSLLAYQKEFKATEQVVKDFAKSKIPNKQKEMEEKARLEAEKEAERWRLYNLYYPNLQALLEASPASENATAGTPEDEAAEANDDEAAEPNEDDAAATADEGGNGAETDVGEAVVVTSNSRKPQYRARAIRDKAEELLKGYPEEPEASAKLLATLFTGKTLAEMIARKNGVNAPPKGAAAKSQLDLIDVPYPNLDQTERAFYATRQKRPIEEDLEMFELRKMADVYGLPLKPGNSVKAATVELRDRNAVEDTEAVEDPNGRPKRNRNKPTTYETEQSVSQGESSEELPAKRRRIQTQATTTNGSPARARTATETRDGSPAPRTFASGKRIGRPPGSKTKIKPEKSKLQQSHLPPKSPSESETPIPDGAQSHTQDLPANEEAQLQEAAQFLVKKTAKGKDVIIPPKKGQHGGARTKKAKPEVEEPVKPARGVRGKKQPEAAPAKPRKGGRAKKEVTQKTGLPNVDEHEVVQSTEQDDESRFASASTSRPTTSSSGATVTTLGSRRATRQSTREQSKVNTEQAAANEASANQSAPAKGKAKRKRGANEPQIVEPEQQQVAIVAPPAKKRRTKEQEESPVDVAVANGEASAPTSSRQKRKRAPTLTQDSIQVALPDPVEDEEESTPPAPKRRKGGKAAATQPSASDPHGIYESTPPPTKAPKAGGRRKKVVAKPSNIIVLPVNPVLPSDTKKDAESMPAPPKIRIKTGKSKALKQSSTESEYVSGDGEETSRKTRKARPITRRKNGKRTIAEVDSDDETSEPAPKKRVGRKTKTNVATEPETDINELTTDGEVALAVKRTPGRQAKAKASKQAEDGDDEGDDPAPPKKRVGRKAKAAPIQEPDYEMEDDETEAEGVAKAGSRRPSKAKAGKKGKSVDDGKLSETELNAKEQKRLKLSIATKLRWASGKMVGPMQKRQATNEAKKAARLAAKNGTQDSAAPIQPATIAGLSTTIASAPPPATASASKPAPAPLTISASSSATRQSGRKRKPTSRAMMGLDGADDSDDEDDDDDRPEFRSEYDTFQALSSPGTPALGKRKPSYFVPPSALVDTSGDDGDDSY